MHISAHYKMGCYSLKIGGREEESAGFQGELGVENGVRGRVSGKATLWNTLQSRDVEKRSVSKEIRGTTLRTLFLPLMLLGGWSRFWTTFNHFWDATLYSLKASPHRDGDTWDPVTTSSTRRRHPELRVWPSKC